MKRVVLCFVLLLAACDARVTPSAPSVVAAETTVVPAVVIIDPPPVTVAPPSSATPEPVPTLPTGRAFVRTDCDYSNLSAIRCYNPSRETIVLSAASIGAGSTGCNARWAGVHENVRIAPGTNGYFTVPGPGCGQTFQLDMFRGSTVGSCVNPDFTAERTYRGPDCPLPPPPPPPPPPVCVPAPAGACGPWMLHGALSFTTQPNECTPRAWIRACPRTCNAPPLVEGPVMSCEAPQ